MTIFAPRQHAAHHLSSLRPLGVALVAAGLMLSSLALHAAPMASAGDMQADSQEAARARAAAKNLDEQRITDAQGQSKTIQMLLDLQQAPAPLEGSGQSKREQAAQARAAKAAGQEEVPVQAVETQTLDWRSGLPGRTVSAQQVPESSGSSGPRTDQPVRTATRATTEDSGESLRDWLPRQWIGFLRENRNWVLASGLGLLGLGWLVTGLLTRRR